MEWLVYLTINPVHASLRINGLGSCEITYHIHMGNIIYYQRLMHLKMLYNCFANQLKWTWHFFGEPAPTTQFVLKGLQAASGTSIHALGQAAATWQQTEDGLLVTLPDVLADAPAQVSSVVHTLELPIVNLFMCVDAVLNGRNC